MPARIGKRFHKIFKNPKGGDAKRFTNRRAYAILFRMKKVIEVENLCCKKCAERAEKKLLLLDGVTGAKANFKRGIILVESTLPDEALAACVRDAGFGVKEIRPRKGIFG